MPESPYSPEFVAAQKVRLLEERAIVMSDIDADQVDLLEWSSADSEEIGQHPADEATALTEQELDLSLLQNSRYILHEIDDAVARIGAGTYGWDEEAACWIREERLQALPWARREVEGQRRAEQEQERARADRDSYTHDTDITSL